MNRKSLIFIFIFALLISTASALDICSGPTKVAVIVNDDCPPGSPAYSPHLVTLIESMGFTAELVPSSNITNLNLNQYAFMLVDDHYYTNYYDFPINDFPVVMLNTWHLNEWHWSTGVSIYSTTTFPASVEKELTHDITDGLPQFSQVYTSTKTNGGQGTYLSVDYLSRFDKAAQIKTITTKGTTPSNPNDDQDATIAIAEPGTQLLHGFSSDVRTCWLGFTQKDYWTADADTLFKQCVTWVTLGDDHDNDNLYAECDNCPTVNNANQLDSDNDGVGNACDNCASISNSNQLDSDNDGIGNVCDICPSSAGNDADGDGVCAPTDCNDNDATVKPGAPELICNGIDNDCDGVKDEGYATVSCGTGQCGGMTSCENGAILCKDSGVNQAASDCGGCCKCTDSNNPVPSYDGTQNVDCNSYDLPGINTCTYNPDGNSKTKDVASGFDSVCSGINTCTQSTYTFTHTCDINTCGAQCVTNSDCGSYCVADTYYYSGSCQGSCACTYLNQDCNLQDGWYDTGNKRWVSDSECTEKEEKEQQYRDYTCGGINGCSYTVTGTQWILTSQNRNKPNGTICTDGLFCTVEDMCNAGICQGIANTCSDGVSCTIDSCNEASDICQHSTNDAVCNDGLYCNGNEYCDLELDCQEGTPVNTDDAIGCTIDSCDESINQVLHVPDNSICSDGLFCNGEEYCSTVLGCMQGIEVDCSANNINSIDSCQNVPDGNSYTLDSRNSFVSVCVEGETSYECTTGDNTISHSCDIEACGAQCETDSDCGSYCVEDTYFYSGECLSGCTCSYLSENCNSQDGWYDLETTRWVGNDQCTELEEYQQEYRDYTCGLVGCEYSVTQTRWLETGNLRNKPDGTICSDSLFCTVEDMCFEGACIGTAINVDDGLYCTIDSCDELNDEVLHAPISVDDEVTCTYDYCDEETDEIRHAAQDQVCNDGLYCNGNEYCDLELDCQNGTPIDVNDGQFCTVDSCDEVNDVIVNAPISVDDGLYCTVDSCDEENDEIVHSPIAADDSVSCTNDYCDEDLNEIVNAPLDNVCNDGLFCNGEEYCDAELDCQPGAVIDCTGNDISGVEQCNYNPDGNPVTWDYYAGFTSTCDEAIDACTVSVEEVTSACDMETCGAECETNADCGSYCVEDIYYFSGECLSGCTCSYLSENCNSQDGWYDLELTRWIGNDQCTELEEYQQEYRDYTCGLVGCEYSVTQTRWLETGNLRNRENGYQCNDGLFCTTNDVCMEGICQGSALDVNDNLFCTVDSCDETNDVIVNAPISVDDGLYCTVDSCDEVNDVIVNAPISVDDGLYCTVDSCDEVNNVIVHEAIAVDDSVSCTNDYCDEELNQVVNAPQDNVCNDGLFCNGEEYCDAQLDCQPGAVIDCTGNDIPGVEQCNYNPDGNPVTWDYYAGFTSTCDEAIDACTDSVEEVTSACDVEACGAQCDDNSDCAAYCSGNLYYESGSCDLEGSCSCNFNEPFNCDDNDGWYETANFKWIDNDQCTDKKQNQEEYRNYNCGLNGCSYTVTSTRWVNTGDIRNKEDGTTCNDGLFCTTNDMCTAGVCGGSSYDVSDGVTCTNDYCDEELNEIVNVPQDNVCNDGLFCNGNEYCDVELDCQNGTPVDVNDGLYCTVDSCDEVNDVIVNAPISVDDGLYCTVDSCDEVNNVIVHEAIAVDDSVSCTNDYCDEELNQVVNAPQDNVCNDGLFCNGEEYCDAQLDCQPGAVIDCTGNDIPGVEQCNYNPDGNPVTWDYYAGFTSTCDEAIDACTDSVEEVTSACDVEACGAQCDDNSDCAAYCLGSEYYAAGTCDTENSCSCNYNTPINCDYSDGWYETGNSRWTDNDQCKEQKEIEKEYRDYSCSLEGCSFIITEYRWHLTDELRNKEEGTTCNDGLFCTSSDMCIAGVCQGTSYDISDSISCTDDYCDEENDVILHTPQDHICNDGLFCNGEEYCDVELDCQSGEPVDADDGQFCTDDYCDEESNAIVNELKTVDDSVSCTYDYCDEETDEIKHTAQNQVCNDGLFCNGEEYCDAQLDCQPGAVIDCTGNDISGVEQCNYNPDGNPVTWDYYAGFTSTCDEAIDACTTSVEEVTSACDVEACGAQCETNSDCGSYCVEDIYYYSGECLSGCTCSYLSEDCNLQDGWYYTGNTRWIENDQCTEIQQVEREYRDYTCGGIEGCSYTVTEYKWTLTENIRNVQDGTACNADSLYCTVDDMCIDGACVPGELPDCSGNDIDGIDTCNYQPDGITSTYDSRNSFISSCIESEQGYECTTGSEEISHVCDVETCGAECYDGNFNDGDGCNSQCVIEYCGDGIIHESLNEFCDDGNNENGDGCNSQCVVEYCGDGADNNNELEECDDGNQDNNDYCRSDCTLPGCGDGYLNPDEACDDGNEDNFDACSNLCISNYCGDSVVNNGEQCDDGNEDNFDSCSNACITNYCGDSVVNNGEACDDGNNANGDGCTSQCVVEYCGDGIDNNAETEECDDGNEDNFDTCSNSCITNYCGDEVVNNGEACDDGNNANGDGCTSQCVVEYCGDGIDNNNEAEECDDGNEDNFDACSNVCVSNYCGDSVVNNGEECDDGNEDNFDACSNVCIAAFCGDTIVNNDEYCDDGNSIDDDQCSNLCQLNYCGDNKVNNGELCDDGNNVDNDGCTSQCAIEYCGDHVTQSNEACDDGNNANGDGCTSQCVVEYCGDGIDNNKDNEECDDGNEDNYDTCSNSCTLTYCGDSTVNNGEQCDDGNDVNTDSCTNTCKNPACGDTYLQEGEQCDDGNVNSNDGCDSQCVIEYCGDHVTQSSEACDDGNNENGDGCTSQCIVEYCGDGIDNNNEAEECDDGNTNNNDACLNTCNIAYCGDSVTETGVEACDDGNENNNDSCRNDCTFPVCGDGYQNPGEECDDGNTDNTDSCLNTCDLSDCGDSYVQEGVEECDDGNTNNNDACLNTCNIAYCGDSVTETGVEACDDGNENNNDSCRNDCTFPVCGDSYLNPGEQCDDGNNDNTDSCLTTCKIAGCGDGFTQEEIEECDDGNTNNNDACLNTCNIAYCGDSITQYGEEDCDDGNDNNNDYCRNDCSLPVCGDGYQNPGEACDDGNNNSNDGCNAICVLEVCGDGIVQDGIGEVCEYDSQCDDGNYKTQDVCGESTCGCSNVQICEDECTPGEDDICAEAGVIVLSCKNSFDSDPCYEWGKKEDCSTRDSCVVRELETPYCTECPGNNCGTACYETETLYGTWSCGEGAECQYTLAQDFIDADDDKKDDRCDDCVDMDYDGICDHEDTCKGIYNPTNVDSDNDGFGNACDEDRDNDGYPAGNDCNDWDPKINPGASEKEGDGKDNDCNPLTLDKPEKIRSEDLIMTTRILNEDTAMKEGQLALAVYVKNTGDIKAKDVRITATIMDEFITDQMAISSIGIGKTERVLFYLPIDSLDSGSEYYIRTVMNVETVKKAKYSQFVLG